MKTIQVLKGLLVVMGFGLLSATASAQNPETGALMTDPNIGCAYGYDQYGYMNCGGSGGSRGSSAPSKPRVLASRYGAVALDFKTGNFNSAYGETSEINAKRNALTRCGSKNCKLIANYRNTCVAVAWGSLVKQGISRAGFGTTTSLAEQNALQVCSKQGGRNCKIMMPAECSSPQ